MIDGLEVRAEAWQHTADYLETGEVPDGFVIEECSDAEEAQRLAEHYERIIASLTVQNRRKSRMGQALQHHLAEVFTRQGLQFKAQARTEAGNKPDFIFPGEAAYQDPVFDASLLVMLGVKSSAKDRWRQILPEAARIPHKHLCTLQPGISENQTEQMLHERVQLVIPASIQPTYSPHQRTRLLDLSGFVGLVREKQR